MILSVCIATVPERASLLTRMLHSLIQPGINEQYEILVHGGTRPHGEKVNRLFSSAAGTHVVLMDDDDWVAANYIESVVPFTEDFVGYKTVCLVEGAYSQTVTHDAHQYREWVGPLRGVSQKCPIRRELAVATPYPDDYYKDGEWSMMVQDQLTSWGYCDRELYFYDYYNQDRHRYVGWWPVDKSLIRWL